MDGSRVEADKRAAEYEAEAQKHREEWRRENREMNKRWGEIANKMGSFVEDIVAPNIPRIANELLGIEALDVFSLRRCQRHPARRDQMTEYDALAAGNGYLIVVESKSSPRPEHVAECKAKLERLPEFLPEYANHRIVPIFAALLLDGRMVSLLTRERIYALAMGAVTMELLNRDAVRLG